MTGSYSDFHNHLVPGVDDGSRSVADALHSMERMVEAGVVRIITTPHFLASSLDSPLLGDLLAYHDERWRSIRDAARQAFPQLDFRRGFEVRLDTSDPDLSDRRTRLGGTRFALVEWPGFRAPANGPEVMSRLVASGCVPVVAHPERYRGLGSGLRAAHAWKKAGAWLQGNYGSLSGQYGPGPKARIMRMLSEGTLDYLSSDFHGRPEYTFYMDRGVEVLQQWDGDAQLRLLGQENPARLFRGESPRAVPPLRIPEPFKHQMGGWVDG